MVDLLYMYSLLRMLFHYSNERCFGSDLLFYTYFKKVTWYEAESVSRTLFELHTSELQAKEL
jgi:hypothetical protein